MKKIVFILTLLFAICGCKKNNDGPNNAAKTSTTYKDLEASHYDTIARSEYLELAYKENVNKNYKKYYQICKKVETESTKINDYKGLIYASMYIGKYQLNKFSTDSAYYYFTKAEKLSKKINDNSIIEYLIQYKADILWARHDYASAEREAIKALKIAISKENYFLAYSSCITIANSLAGMNNTFKALDYYRRAIKMVDKSKTPVDASYKVYPHMYIAKIYQQKGQHQRTIGYLNEHFNLTDLKKIDIHTYCYIVNMKAYSKYKLGDTEAVEKFKQTLRIGDSLNYAPIQIASKKYLGEYYLDNQNLPLANKYLYAAQELSHRHHIFEDELEVLKLLAKSNPQKASHYANSYIHLNDSIQRVERASRDKFSRIEFETDEIITENNNLTQEKDKIAIQRWFIAGFSVMLILLLLLWYRNKLQNAKTRELLLKQEQQKAKEEIYQLMLNQQQKIEEGKQIEKQRISLELHDGVMGRLSAIRMNMFPMIMTSGIENKDDYYKQLDDIQSIEKEIRNIAHELSANLFSDNVNFIAIVKELFTKIENHSNIHFDLYADDLVNWDLVNNNIKINLYRILQEALQNIEKYANATQVSVKMSQEGQEIKITISDNGRGFNVKAKKMGIGLKNMQTRMDELKGILHIASTIGKGTKISLTIPI